MSDYNYRLQEFKKISTVQDEFLPHIKIVKVDGETKWLDITEEELQKIKNILTKQEAER